jgi:hypothetical protein
VNKPQQAIPSRRRRQGGFNGSAVFIRPLIIAADLLASRLRPIHAAWYRRSARDIPESIDVQ